MEKINNDQQTNPYELKDLVLKVVDDDFARSFISRYHYSKTCSNIVVALGEFVG